MSADFKDLLKLLNEHATDYLLIGGYAVNFYGYVRNTGDMDIWVRPDDENIRRTAAALEDFGYASADESLPVLKIPGKILRMGIPPFRIEVSTTIDGVEFADCFERRVGIDFDGIPMNFIGLTDLLINKRTAGRLKDLADVEELEKRNPS